MIRFGLHVALLLQFLSLARRSGAHKCIQNNTELLDAVDEYLLEYYGNDEQISPRENKNETEVAIKYGWPIGNWCVGNVTDFSDVFRWSKNKLATKFNEPLAGWDLGSATTTSNMFAGAENFNQKLPWDVSQVTDMWGMFFNAQRFNQSLPWNVSEVTDMSLMFSYALEFNQDLPWDVSQVRDMELMFYNASMFNGNISMWNTSQVLDMSAMFQSTSFDQDISSWNVQKVTDFQSMFERSNLNQNLCKWGAHLEGRQSEDVLGMFYDTLCRNAANPNVTYSPIGPLCHDCSKRATPTCTQLNIQYPHECCYSSRVRQIFHYNPVSCSCDNGETVNHICKDPLVPLSTAGQLQAGLLTWFIIFSVGVWMMHVFIHWVHERGRGLH